jgi:large subunit ribosomal protein L23
MEITEIIRRGIVTEKSVAMQTPTAKQQERKPVDQQTHRYVFEVAMKANKIMIRKAVEEMFPDITVLAVNTMHMPGKSRTFRTRRGVRRSKARPWKKAIITVPANQTITSLQP